MGFKVDLTPPFKAEIDSVKGGFKNVAPFKKRRKPRKSKANRKRSLFDLLDMGISIGFNKGGIVAKTKSKFKGHF
jgi:hypothetical protein